MQKGVYFTTINTDEVPEDKMVEAIANTIRLSYPLVYNSVAEADEDTKPEYLGQPNIRYVKMTFEEIDPKDYRS